MSHCDGNENHRLTVSVLHGVGDALVVVEQGVLVVVAPQPAGDRRGCGENLAAVLAMVDLELRVFSPAAV